MWREFDLLFIYLYGVVSLVGFLVYLWEDVGAKLVWVIIRGSNLYVFGCNVYGVVFFLYLDVTF